jgi:hypothetical protein
MRGGGCVGRRVEILGKGGRCGGWVGILGDGGTYCAVEAGDDGRKETVLDLLVGPIDRHCGSVWGQSSVKKSFVCLKKTTRVSVREQKEPVGTVTRIDLHKSA